MQVFSVGVEHSVGSCQAVPRSELGGRAWAVGTGAHEGLLEVQVCGAGLGEQPVYKPAMHVGAKSNGLSVRLGETKMGWAQRVGRFAL